MDGTTVLADGRAPHPLLIPCLTAPSGLTSLRRESIGGRDRDLAPARVRAPIVALSTGHGKTLSRLDVMRTPRSSEPLCILASQAQKTLKLGWLRNATKRLVRMGVCAACASRFDPLRNAPCWIVRTGIRTRLSFFSCYACRQRLSYVK